jgi:tripartite-type tricarboxylate transporter receptor subunit TctC
VLRAPADGYTLSFASAGHIAVKAAVTVNPRNDPLRLEPVSMAAVLPMILLVNPSLPAANIQEFIKLGRDNPGKYSYGSSGVGTITHLVLELFRSEANIDLRHVPYRGASQATQDLMAARFPSRLTRQMY